MQEVRKKSTDEAVNQMLLAAYRRQTPLTWDRAEAMEPQCGFGKVSICCSECHEGPCRVNPFGTKEQQTICGRNKQELAAGQVLKKVNDGVLALLKLAAEFGAAVEPDAWRRAMTADDEMLLPADYAARLVGLGEQAAATLKNIRQLKADTAGFLQPDVVGVNLGVLEAGTANIVLHGHVAPAVVAGILQAAGDSKDPVNVVALCGSETSGAAVPVVTNYDSQEIPLLTGAVDLIILGNQCVMPATVKLAGQLGIQICRANAPAAAGDYAAMVQAAVRAFRARSSKPVTIPPVKSEIYAGYTAANSQQLLAILAQGKGKGMVYLGGCGNIANTQDGGLVKTAKDLVYQGYLVVTAGCAGTALAKAGLCQPDYNNGNYPAAKILPAGTPPVLFLGSCHDAGEFISMAQAAGRTPVGAIFPEFAHNKVLATAIGFAVTGINTWLGLESVFADSETAGQLSDGLWAKTGARVLPLAGLGEIAGNLAEAAAGK